MRRMVRPGSLFLVMALAACGDDKPTVPDIPERELSGYEKVLASRPPPRAMSRQRDDATGISVAFPKGWRVERDGEVVYRAQSNPDSERHFAQKVVVQHVEFDGTLDAYLEQLRQKKQTEHRELEEIVSGGRRIGDWEGRTYRYRYPWKRGRVVEEVMVFQQDERLCVVTGICHEIDRPTFTLTFTIILQSFQWPKPD